MKIHFSYKNADGACKDILERYVTAEKLKSLANLLQHGNYDLADLDIRVEYQAHHNSFEIKMSLDIASRVLFVQESGFNVTEVFDLVLRKIITQLRRMEGVRHKK